NLFCSVIALHGHKSHLARSRLFIFTWKIKLRCFSVARFDDLDLAGLRVAIGELKDNRYARRVALVVHDVVAFWRSGGEWEGEGKGNKRRCGNQRLIVHKASHKLSTGQRLVASLG